MERVIIDGEITKNKINGITDNIEQLGDFFLPLKTTYFHFPTCFPKLTLTETANLLHLFANVVLELYPNKYWIINWSDR